MIRANIGNDPILIVGNFFYYKNRIHSITIAHTLVSSTKILKAIKSNVPEHWDILHKDEDFMVRRLCLENLKFVDELVNDPVDFVSERAKFIKSLSIRVTEPRNFQMHY